MATHIFGGVYMQELNLCPIHITTTPTPQSQKKPSQTNQTSMLSSSILPEVCGN